MCIYYNSSCIVAILVAPSAIRQVRAELKIMAEKASHEVFATNLKQLLLAPPLKGKPILGIDPGYTNGCKMALISTTGAVVSYNTIYPHKSPKDAQKGAEILRQMTLEQK